MSRPAGVTVSAVFLILGSLLTAAMGAFFLIAPSFAPPTTPQPPFVKAIMVGTAVVFVGCALWGVLTSVGLIRMRRWARISIVVIGALLVTFFGFSLVMILFVSQFMPEFKSTPGASMVVGMLSAIYLIPITFGIWWLIYFNRAAVKVAFVQGFVPDEGPHRPLSIVVIAWHLVVIGLLTPMGLLWFQPPAIILGMVLTGWSATLVYCAYAIVELSIGAGLLRLRPWSITAAMWFFIFGMLNSILFAFVPNSNAKILTAMKAVFPDVSARAGSIELPSPIYNAAFGVLMMALPLYYLVTRKRAFLDAGRKPEVAE